MSAKGIVRAASVLCLAALPACAANNVNLSQIQRAEPVQLRPPEFNSSPFDLLRARIAQRIQANAAATVPVEDPLVAQHCANTDNMPRSDNVEREWASRLPLLFLRVGTGSGGALPMPNGCDPKVDSTRSRIGRN